MLSRLRWLVFFAFVLVQGLLAQSACSGSDEESGARGGSGGRRDAGAGSGGRDASAGTGGIDASAGGGGTSGDAGADSSAADASDGSSDSAAESSVEAGAPGALDTAFAAAGVLRVRRGTDTLFPQALLVQEDDRFIVASVGRQAIDIRRFMPDGAPDTSFAGGAYVHPVNTSQVLVRQLVRQPDGKLIAIGRLVPPASADAGDDSDMFAIRLHADGAPDAQFGNTTAPGLSVLDFGGHDEAYSAHVASDGKILIAGDTSPGVGGSALLVRLRADGTLDDGFQSSGKRLFSDSNSFEPNSA